jgi:hypothetical protein
MRNHGRGLSLSRDAHFREVGEPQSPGLPNQPLRDNVKYLIEQLEAGHSETLTAYLNAMANFHTYSLLC